MLRISFYIIFTLILTAQSLTAQTNLLFIGDEIKQHIYIRTHFIAENSDTLIYNNKILQRNIDYDFNRKFKRFELHFISINANDSLVMKYHSLPSWLQHKYGDELPPITPQSKTATIQLPTDFQSEKPPISDMQLSGSKSFRFSTSKSGTQGFNQTLDLKLSGHLAHNLTLKGTISDRGYNPSYGSSNSRLNELDKINLAVESPNFKSQIGDFVIGTNNKRMREKKISGVHLQAYNKFIQIGMIAARPKGQYQTVSLLGADKKQGPYLIISEGVRQAIIPGSEIVWLDGSQLKRGSSDDYTFDYPNGQITFNANHLIDTRTRIVIDYEPLSSAYKQEYLHANSKVAIMDSTVLLDFNWIREGDNKDENLSQIFSQSDKVLLANQTNGQSVFKSGLLSDSIGDYEILLDSLPDTIYNFVGDGLGKYNVHFSFVETGNGDYSYQGGNQYLYVGVGGGDYLPLILLRTPKRTDYITNSIGIIKNNIGSFNAEWSQSRSIENLFSQENISVNKNYYFVNYEKFFTGSNNKFTTRYSKKEFGYRDRNRTQKADYKYEFYFPIDSNFTTSEELTSIGLSLQQNRFMKLQSNYSLLNFSDQFSAINISFISQLIPANNLFLVGSMKTVNTKLFTDTAVKRGNSNIYNLSVKYNFYKKYKFQTSYQKTERTNNYEVINNGFAHDAYTLKIGNQHSELSYQYYTEDTLLQVWTNSKKRKRIQLKTDNKIKQFQYKLQLYYQESEGLLGNQTSLLAKTNLSYTNRKQNLQIHTSYILSDEIRFSKGIRYLEVNDGEGDYIFVDSQYVPEAGGNYILVEELLSDAAPVKRGEKSFSFSKKWDKFSFRLTSLITEELFDNQSRSNFWIIPIYSDTKLSYLFFKRFTKGSIRAFPINGGYLITLNFSQKKESRFINQQNRLKESFHTETILTHNINNIFVEEKFEFFNDKRDVYYSRAGNIDGFAVSGKLKYLQKYSEYSVKLKFRSAISVESQKSNIYMLVLENRLNLLKHSELKLQTEFYKSNNNSFSASESYLITDNRPGLKGAIWSIICRTKIKKEFRLNFTIQGRHSDNNKARIFARTELVAQF